MARWGAGGLRIGEVSISDPSPDDARLSLTITYDPSSLDEAVFCVGFASEGGVELAATSSTPVSVDPHGGVVVCRVDPFPFRPGIYFPVVAAVAPGGVIHDRWKLDRAIVVDGDLSSSPADDLGPVRLTSSWVEDEIGEGSTGREATGP
jgi:hypothetical protein